MNFQMLHGECVAVGMVAAAYISHKRGYISFAEVEQMKNTLVQLNLPISIDKLDEQELISITKNDKKMEAGKIKFILLEAIGKAVIDSTVTVEEMIDGIRYIMK